MSVAKHIAAVCLALVCLQVSAAEFRFPMPEFESGYQRPAMHTPPPSLTSPVVDVVVLTACLSLSAWLVLRRRSRPGVIALAVFSLCYFGFYRKGCVCSVGALQNVLNALIGDGLAVPLVVSVFFVLPILFALFFGRVFCAAVCPLGAVQEVCAVHPVQVPKPADAVLGLFAYAYLGVTVLGLATGSGFLICRYDPFVGFFRQGGSFNMLLAGGVLLAAGIFVARPYCRYLCPYGVLLRWASLLARRHAAITPGACIQCRLCEASCPYHAIVYPTPAGAPEPRNAGTRRLARLLIIAPVVVLVLAGAGYAAHGFLARLHPTVWLADRIAEEEAGQAAAGPNIDTDTFRAGNASVADLYAQASEIEGRFRWPSALFGAFMGLVICARLFRYSVVRRTTDYEIDRGACVSCARCFPYCPVEKSDVIQT